MSSPWIDFAHSSEQQISEAEAEAEWARYLMTDAQAAYDNGSVQIREIGTVDGSQLSQLIKSNGGKLEVAASDQLAHYAQSRWWQFSVAFSTDGRMARITENNYLLYGGIGAAALLLITFLGSR